jgi:hypothetical protein
LYCIFWFWQHNLIRYSVLIMPDYINKPIHNINLWWASEWVTEIANGWAQRKKEGKRRTKIIHLETKGFPISTLGSKMFTIISEHIVIFCVRTILYKKIPCPFNNHVRSEWPQSSFFSSLVQVVDLATVFFAQVPDGLLYNSSEDK